MFLSCCSILLSSIFIVITGYFNHPSIKNPTVTKDLSHFKAINGINAIDTIDNPYRIVKVNVPIIYKEESKTSMLLSVDMGLRSGFAY